MIEYSRVGTELVRDPTPPWCFPTPAPQGRRDALLCGWLGDVEQRRPDGTVIRYHGLELGAVGFIDHDDVVLNAFGSDWPPPVHIGHSSGRQSQPTGLFSATASCAAGPWVAASRQPARVTRSHGVYDVRSRVLVALAPDFEIRGFSPDCRFVAGSARGYDLVVADTSNRTVLYRLSLGWHARHWEMFFEDEDHLLLHRSGSPVVRIAIDGTAEIATTRPHTFVVMPPR